MKSKEISATINIELPNTASKNYGPATRQVLQNVNATIDFYDGKIYCDLKLSLQEVLFFSTGCDINAVIQTANYSHKLYKGKENFRKIPAVSMSTDISGGAIDKIGMVSLSFLPTNGYISLEPKDEDKAYALVFSGARNNAFDSDVEYNGLRIHISSPKNSDLLEVTSVAEIPEKILPLITLSFSLFQGAQIRLLEKHTPEEFLLYLQLPPSPGTRLCDDTRIFSLIWKWLADNNNFLSQRNWLEFLLTGTKARGEYIDFRLLNLFVSLNSRCGRGDFGHNIAQCFMISEEDGRWLAYVRNSMVHEGAAITAAIDHAFVEFSQKQKNSKVNRYAAYKTAKDKNNAAFALYCDIIDLFMEHLMKTIGYKGTIKKMVDIFNITIK